MSQEQEKLPAELKQVAARSHTWRNTCSISKSTLSRRSNTFRHQARDGTSGVSSHSLISSHFFWFRSLSRESTYVDLKPRRHSHVYEPPLFKHRVDSSSHCSDACRYARQSKALSKRQRGKCVLQCLVGGGYHRPEHVRLAFVKIQTFWPSCVCSIGRALRVGVRLWWQRKVLIPRITLNIELIRIPKCFPILSSAIFVTLMKVHNLRR